MCGDLAIKAIDLTGNRYGRLTVIETIYNYNGKGQKFCRCICDCGNKKLINAQSLSRGCTKSCGCLEKESRYTRKHGKYKRGEVLNGIMLIEETEKRESNKAIVWKCKCPVCGNIFEISPSQIIHHKISSCGCDYTHPLLHDLTGQRFGLLTVVSIVPRAKRNDKGFKRVMWNCACDCGRHTIAQADMLISGDTTSCGCRINKSAMVKIIRDCLSDKSIVFYEEHRFPDCKDVRPLPFDFYIPEYNTVIEYDGRQHFVPVKIWGGDAAFARRMAHDAIKNEYCKEKNINMVRLPYYLTQEEIIRSIDELVSVTSKRLAQ